MESTAARVLAALKPYNLKQTAPNQYRCNSPLRPGSDSHGFTLHISGPEHGGWQDFAGNQSGSLYELARQLGIEPAAGPVADTKRRYADLADYAAAHGLTADQLTAAGWRQVSRAGRPALQFPTATGQRWRFLDGNKPYYVSEPGYTKCWYGLKNVGPMVMAGQPLVICNGEISVIAAQQHGIAAIAVTSGEARIPDALLDELKIALDWAGEAQAEILIALDCDKTGRAAALAIREQLMALGFAARAIDLGLGERADLADFCLLYHAEAAEALPRCADLSASATVDIPQGIKVFGQGSSWYLMHARDRHMIPPVEWLFPGEIPSRSISVLYAPPGTGKSFVAIDYALRLAQSTPVVYVASEGEHGYRARIDAWCKFHNQPEGELYLCMGAVSLMDDAEIEAFLTPLHQIRPRMVIVDTLADSMLGADENSTRDVGEYMSKVNRIKRELDTTLLLIHHTNKGGIQERGNIRIRGSADAVLRLIPEDDIIRLESSKMKDARAFPSRELALMSIPILIEGKEIESAVIVDAEKIVPDADRLTTNQQKILEVFALDVFESGAEVADIVDMTDIGRGSVQRSLSRLLRLGLVAQQGKKAPYTLTEKGREVLTRMTRLTRMTHTESIQEPLCNPVIQPSHASQASHQPLRLFEEDKPSSMNYYANGH